MTLSDRVKAFAQAVGDKFASLAPPYFIPGTSSDVPGVSIKNDWLHDDDGVFNLGSLGALWSAGTVAHIIDAWRATTSTLPDDSNGTLTGGPDAHQLIFTEQAGAEGDVVGILNILYASASNVSLFNENNVAFSSNTATGVNVTIREDDVQMAADVAAGSAVWKVNAFNHDYTMPVALVGGISGTFQNGFITSHIRGAHYSVNAGDPTTSASFIDTTNGTFTRAIVLGKGSGQCICFGPNGFGADPIVYADTGDNLIIDLGVTDDFRICDHSGTIRWEFNVPNKTFSMPTTTVGALPAAGTAGRRSFVTDANATTFASVVAGGGSNKVPVYDDGTSWRIG